jgi:hypothetical protein
VPATVLTYLRTVFDGSVLPPECDASIPTSNSESVSEKGYEAQRSLINLISPPFSLKQTALSQTVHPFAPSCRLKDSKTEKGVRRHRMKFEDRGKQDEHQHVCIKLFFTYTSSVELDRARPRKKGKKGRKG